jgi:hypothetical protein
MTTTPPHVGKFLQYFPTMNSTHGAKLTAPSR